MSETGNAKNAINFEQAVNIVGNLGAAYNPSQNLIKLPNLLTKLAGVQNALTAVNTKEAAETVAVNLREAEFEGIGKLATRIRNAVAVNVNDETFSKDVDVFVRKIQGRRAGEKPVDDPSTPDVDESQSAHSVAQLSYDNQTANFAGLIALLKNEPTYAPNETDVKVATLEAKLAAMESTNAAAKAAILDAQAARDNRDTLLYDEQTGVITAVDLIKKYVKYAFGADSLAYKQLVALKFRKYKK